MTNSVDLVSQDEILKMLGLTFADVLSININHDQVGIIIDITLNPKPHSCPICSASTTKIKGYQYKTIKHSVFNHIPCTIHYRARRYICPLCKRSFFESNPFARPGSNISMLTVYNVLKDLKDPALTFTAVAKRHSLSASSVALIFDKGVIVPRRPLPVCLSLDEVAAFKTPQSNYVCILVDYIDKKVVDLLPSRKKADLIDYFYAIPLEERKKVKYVSFDMWFSYREVSRLLFPNCKMIVDKFHVLQELTRRVTKVRVRVMNRFKHISDRLEAKAKQLKACSQILPPEAQEKLYQAQINYYLLKKFDWMIMSKDPKIDDPNVEKRFNRKLNRYCNLYDLMTMIEAIDPELTEAIEIKEMIFNFYRHSTINNAEKELTDIIITLRRSTVPELSSFANTLTQWKREIVNSFIMIKGINKKMNNGFIENRNKTIKLIKHSSNGYHNWNRFRSRVLYCLNDDVPIKL